MTWVAHFNKQMALKGAVASVSLSHEQDCDCIVCRAAHGDKDAFAHLLEQRYLIESANQEQD